MAFQDYYSQLPDATYPKTDFVRNLAKECNVSVSTVRCWVAGERTPSKEHWPTIAAITGIPQNELFTAKTTAQ